MAIKTVGSVCSGIEAASVAWQGLGLKFEWFAEIADFPSKLLAEKYPTIPNHGDMAGLADKILAEEIAAPDLICGGTPCQAFSLAGWRQGLADDRGNLTLAFVDIVNATDKIRKNAHLPPTVVFWENVEGVLKDKTNAFGSFVSSLAGLGEVLTPKKWANAGFIKGKRNVAWRVLDAKYFGLPQQRRRLYVLAGNIDVANVLFEHCENGENLQKSAKYPSSELNFSKNGDNFEIFREYTDCLYSSYGTKWNGNAAAYNGSLYVVQNGRIRRLSPLECERLMGFPDNYTNIAGTKRTNRYQAVGNSWAIPVVRWLGERILAEQQSKFSFDRLVGSGNFWDFHESPIICENGFVNVSETPQNTIFGNMQNIVDSNAPKEIYISPVGCNGIIRRKAERNLKINSRLEEVLLRISQEMSAEEIERRSRVQKRGNKSKLNVRGEMEQIYLN
ncbi:MAG: DNA cytosine methyltransferase [Defluviitaleaceae bacterium]|nr:DNA cytosine methyltransferase [Defluviitaleaceae bacterium]